MGGAWGGRAPSLHVAAAAPEIIVGAIPTRGRAAPAPGEPYSNEPRGSERVRTSLRTACHALRAALTPEDVILLLHCYCRAHRFYATR